MAGIAAPVHGPGGLVVGALGISGPVEELDAPGARGELRAMVVAAAASVTRELLS